jgi:hypothetical protein
VTPAPTELDTAEDPATGSPGPGTLIATPAQLFAGLELEVHSRPVACTDCGTRLTTGDAISLSAYRPVEHPHWSLGRVCSDVGGCLLCNLVNGVFR